MWASHGRAISSSSNVPSLSFVPMPSCGAFDVFSFSVLLLDRAAHQEGVVPGPDGDTRWWHPELGVDGAWGGDGVWRGVHVCWQHRGEAQCADQHCPSLHGDGPSEAANHTGGAPYSEEGEGGAVEAMPSSNSSDRSSQTDFAWWHRKLIGLWYQISHCFWVQCIVCHQKWPSRS